MIGIIKSRKANSYARGIGGTPGDREDSGKKKAVSTARHGENSMSRVETRGNEPHKRM